MTAPNEPDTSRSFGSRLLSAADQWASRPVTGLAVIALAGSWITISVIAGFPDHLERAFEVLVAALTLAMLFVVQHTQARLQHATQRKLDELLHALPEADNAMVRLEHGSDAELRAAGDTHRQVRQSAADQDDAAADAMRKGTWSAAGAVGVETPVGIDRARHHELAGRGRHVWWRRIVLCMIAAIPALALLNVFGQHASTQAADSPAAQLLINSPSHVRGGLIFTTEITITPHQALKDAQLYLDNGWFQGMTLNALQPTPGTETAEGPWQVLDFGKLPAATAFHIWIAWQVNPTNTGRHPQDVALYNGGTQLMTIHRAITVFP